MAYIAHVVTGAVRWEYAILVCVLFVSSRLVIVFNPSTGTITDNNQLTNGIGSYFKSQLYVADSCHRKPILILLNELSKPRERAHDRIFNICRGWDTNPQPLDWQFSVITMSYHRSLPGQDRLRSAAGNRYELPAIHHSSVRRLSLMPARQHGTIYHLTSSRQ